jgi:hypothetical protein
MELNKGTPPAAAEKADLHESQVQSSPSLSMAMKDLALGLPMQAIQSSPFLRGEFHLGPRLQVGYPPALSHSIW